ncbi:MAG: hypothetical protein G01um1014107_253, partial [Parcubacteria group bacterium Gr01-1014_107]
KYETELNEKDVIPDGWLTSYPVCTLNKIAEYSIEIISDESKTSGVIKPVFRKDTGEEYLYVMVPVK